jgi:hypothetical protein
VDAYEAVIRRAGAARLGVMGDESYGGQKQVSSGGGGGGGGGRGVSYIITRPAAPWVQYNYGAGPATPAVKPVVKVSPFKKDETLAEATARICGKRPTSPGQPSEAPYRTNYPLGSGGTAQYNGAVALYNARASAYNRYLKAIAAWEKCSVQVMKDWNADGRQASASSRSTWPMITTAAPGAMALVSYPTVYSPAYAAAALPTVTSSGFRMNVTPMDFASWMAGQRGRA